MFKFVVPSPRAGFGHQRRRDDDSVQQKEKRSASLLDYLNKHQDKDALPYKSKGWLEADFHNQGRDLKQTPTPKNQQSASTTKTNTDLFGPKNAVTLEENEGVRNPQHSVTSKCVASTGESFLGERLLGESVTEGGGQSRSTHTFSGKSCAKEKHCRLPGDRGVRRAKNRARPKSADNGTASIRSCSGGKMTHDRYSVSDSEGDSSSWQDQPSPILLTASPPQTALKVPATRLAESPFANGWNNRSSSECGNGEVDENCNYLENAERNSVKSDRNIQQEASDLFCSSLRNNARFAKSVADQSNFTQKRLLPQGPHSFSSKSHGYYEPSSTTGLHGSQPTSGQLFLSGPLFLTDDGCEEDYGENVPRDEITKEPSGTTQTIKTDSLYPISKYNGALCYPNGGMTFHNHIGSSRVGNQETINGNSKYYDPSSKGRSKYEDVISVQKAQAKRHNGKLSPNQEIAHNSSAVVHKRKQRPFEHLRQKTKEYFAMNKIGNVGTNNKTRLKRPMSGKNRGRKQRLSDDDDDDATTVTMVTNSDGAEELSSSSSSSESTTCGSVQESPRSNNLGDQGQEPISSDAFVIEKVERFSLASNELDGFDGIYSPEERRASLRRSISTQSGKLRDRLNAVTDEEGSLYHVTPMGSAHLFNTDEPYSREHYYSGSELEMHSTSRHSSPEVSPSQLTHSRVSELKGKASLGGGSRTSRSLTRLPIRRGSPAQVRRCRSLDRGLRSNFTSALSPSYSDVSGRRSLFNLGRRGSLGSDSDLSLHSSLSRRHARLRKTPSTSSLNDRYKPKIDVAESLSALLLNPIKGSENDRKSLDEYLKHSSWTSSREGVSHSTEDLHLRHTKPSYTPSPGLRKSNHSSSGSSVGGRTPSKRSDAEDRADSTFLKSSTGSWHRESKVISKSQTPDRYPAVGSSPHSISSLLPSPRRDTNAEQEVITIIDNEVLATDNFEHEQTGRRNSFIEAVTGNSSQSAHSNNSEHSDEEDVEHAFKDLAKTAEEVFTPRNSAENSTRHQQPHAIERINSSNLIQVHRDEINVDLTTDPISNDLTVAVVRRPSTRSQSTSSAEPPSPSMKPAYMNHTSGVFYQSVQQEVRPPKRGSGEPSYVNIPQPNGDHANDSFGEIVTVKCRNTRCRKEMCLEDAKAKFKSCHHCYTYYCSHQCRLAHWERHKLKCVFARVNSDCKKILRMGRDDDVMRQAFTRVARTGYLSRGRGCVQVIFSCPEKAENCISEGLFALESLPLFRTVKELTELKARLVENSDLITDALIETCDTAYDPEKSYVLQVLIDIPDEMLARHSRPYRHQNTHGVYLHTINPVYRTEQDAISPQALQNTPETLILTPPTTIPETWLTNPPSGLSFSTPSPAFSVSSSSANSNAFPVADNARNAKRARQLCFINIQRKLREKGVTLRHQYPEVYRKLCAYVDTGAHFTPVVIYPQDTRTGKSFMCLVMPGSEPQILGWVQTPGLLDDIATS